MGFRFVHSLLAVVLMQADQVTINPRLAFGAMKCRRFAALNRSHKLSSHISVIGYSKPLNLNP